jgi:hypothetical protein
MFGIQLNKNIETDYFNRIALLFLNSYGTLHLFIIYTLVITTNITGALHLIFNISLSMFGFLRAMWLYVVWCG